MINPSEYRVRALEPETDLVRWAALIQAAEQADNGAAQTSDEQLRRTLNWPRVQRWVVEAPGDPEQLIGYGLLFMQIPERGALGIVVHPDWRRRGVGRQLLGLVIEAARAAGAGYVYTEENEQNRLAAAFLRSSGFQVAGDTWVLRAPAEMDFPAPLWADGYSVRNYAEIQDIQALLAACNLGYGDMLGHSENTAGGATVEELSGWIADWNPQGIWVAFGPDGAPVGTLRAVAQNSAMEDLIDGPGVAPRHRPLQLQRPLILTAIHWLRQQGRRALRMECWGDSTETVSLYEAMGFKVVEHALSFRLDV